MPWTHFHLGPALFIGAVFRKKFDLVAILLGSIIGDLETLFNYLEGNPIFHGFSHTYFGATLYGIAVASFLFVFADWIKPLKVSADKNKLLLGGIVGTWSHVFFDSFVHSNIIPFWPLHINPFLNFLIGDNLMMAITTLLGIIGIVVWFWKR